MRRKVLSNGLRFVHRYMPDTALVTLDVMYGVGSRNESPDMTGIAHLFEHLMFGGSANVADFDGVLTEAGGVSNAWTSNDFTNFHLTAPAHNAETLFYLESDRMLSPALTDETLDIQRSVVIEEFKQQFLNAPYGDLMHTLRPMVYGESHPYSWPVIGKDFKGLERVTRDDVVRWWCTHYTPHNAVLAVAGKISYDEALRYAEKWFGDISGKTMQQTYGLPVDICRNTEEIIGINTKVVYGRVPATLIIVAYLMDPYGTPDYFAADAITDVLSMGQASRFAQRINLNPDAPLVEADASITGSEGRGMLMLTARLANEDINPDEATRFLIESARSIITEGVSPRELQRLKNRQKAMFVIGNMTTVACAHTLAEAEIHNSTPEFRLEQYEGLTCTDIVRVATDIFDNSNPAIVYYRPLGENVNAQ